MSGGCDQWIITTNEAKRHNERAIRRHMLPTSAPRLAENFLERGYPIPDFRMPDHNVIMPSSIDFFLSSSAEAPIKSIRGPHR
jgi:hypothetical protein